MHTPTLKAIYVLFPKRHSPSVVVHSLGSSFNVVIRSPDSAVWVISYILLVTSLWFKSLLAHRSYGLLDKSLFSQCQANTKRQFGHKEFSKASLKGVQKSCWMEALESTFERTHSGIHHSSNQGKIQIITRRPL